MNSKKLRKTTSSIANVVLITVGLAGCASGPTTYQTLALNTQEDQSVAAKPDYLQPLYTRLFQEGKRNEVLNRMELGAAAFYAGDLDEARESFDVALARIETVYADDPDALKARSLWHEEGRKDFKGEPYERSMAYYYRGLIYLIDGEYDNARASFESGLMQDAFAEEEQNRSDLALMLLLAGWSAQKMGSAHLAEEAYAEFKKLRPDFPIPAVDDNVLVIAETGKAPRKLADGVGHYELVFRPGKLFDEKYLTITTDERSLVMQPLESVYWQASSRGGRPIDAIVEGKAAFREFNADMGTTLADLGVAANVYAPIAGGSTGQVGNTLALIGVAQMALSANTKPRADTRYWSRLPDTVHITSYKTSGNDSVNLANWSATYQDRDRNDLALSSGPFQHFSDNNGNHIIWHSSQSRLQDQ
jgi:tetratricopeptide (TPR) repeat protein